MKDAIGSLMKGRKVTAYELSKTSGVPANHIGAILRGKIKNPGVETLAKLCKTLDVSIDEVVGMPRPRPIVREAGDTIMLPLVAERIAAGIGSWPQETEGTVYAFRRDWKKLARTTDEKRYCLVKLGDRADSMAPDISPGSMLLLDRSEGVRVNPKPGIPYLCVIDRRTNEVALKDVEIIQIGGSPVLMRLTCRNKDYQAKTIELEDDESILGIVKAKLLWHGTEW